MGLINESKSSDLRAASNVAVAQSTVVEGSSDITQLPSIEERETKPSDSKSNAKEVAANGGALESDDLNKEPDTKPRTKKDVKSTDETFNATSKGKFSAEDMVRRHLAQQEGRVQYQEWELCELFAQVSEMLRTEHRMLRIRAPVAIFGDIYGHYKCLHKLLAIAKFPPGREEHGHYTYIFLGNYMTRGNLGIEVICLLFSLKLHLSKYVILLRGNHESEPICEAFGVKKTFAERGFKSPHVWQRFVEVINAMPIAAVVGSRIFCVHSGISHKLCKSNGLKEIQKLSLNEKMVTKGLLTDLLWACPQKDKGWSVNDDEQPVTRLFGKDIIEKFCKANKIDLIIRSRQILNEGALYWPNKKVLNLFSAVNFCGQFQNKAAIATIDQKLTVSIHQYEVSHNDADLGPNYTRLLSTTATTRHKTCDRGNGEMEDTE